MSHDLRFALLGEPEGLANQDTIVGILSYLSNC